MIKLYLDISDVYLQMNIFNYEIWIGKIWIVNSGDLIDENLEAATGGVLWKRRSVKKFSQVSQEKKSLLWNLQNF